MSYNSCCSRRQLTHAASSAAARHGAASTPARRSTAYTVAKTSAVRLQDCGATSRDARRRFARTTCYHARLSPPGTDAAIERLGAKTAPTLFVADRPRRRQSLRVHLRHRRGCRPRHRRFHRSRRRRRQCYHRQVHLLRIPTLRRSLHPPRCLRRHSQHRRHHRRQPGRRSRHSPPTCRL